MPEWFVMMTKDENGEWAAGTRHGAVMVVGRSDLPEGAPVVRWSMVSSALAVSARRQVIVTPSPEAW
jgi:hypothetical protein